MIRFKVAVSASHSTRQGLRLHDRGPQSPARETCASACLTSSAPASEADSARFRRQLIFSYQSMEHTDQLRIFLSMLAVNVPILLVCFVAGVVVLGRWRDASNASLWALLGFGLLLVLCFVMPLAQTMLQQWVMGHGERASRMWAFTAFGIASSILHAIIYALLLGAIYAGRPRKIAA